MNHKGREGFHKGHKDIKSINRLTFAYNTNECKTKVDWAAEVRRLLEEDYPHAERIRLVCDNLNTHTYGVLYEAFPADVALSLSRRLEIIYTPKHGSWLNIAENELSVLTRQCMKGIRFELLESL